MRALMAVVLSVGLGTSISGGQQAAPSAPPAKQDAQPVRVKVYSVGPDVTAPVLLPLAPFTNPVAKCKNKEDGKVLLSLLVDPTGRPRNLVFLQPLGTDLDKFALQIATADRFKPGTYKGAPVAVGESLEVNLQSCFIEKKNDAGKNTSWLQLRSQPTQKFEALPQPTEEAVLTPDGLFLEDAYKIAFPSFRAGGNISAPILIHHVEAEYSDEARRAKYQGECVISVVVDVYGRPQYLHVVRKLGMGLDEMAMEAIHQYRFKPAMKDGVPVPVTLNVAVDFSLY